METDDFRMLNRRPLELPPLDTDVQMVNVKYNPLPASQVREGLRKLPNHLLYNKYSGWYFFLSNTGIGKMTNEFYDNAALTTIHLSAVSNIDTLVRNAVLGYSKTEPPSRINSAGKEVRGNNRIKANHRFYVGAWIENKPYSIRMMVREYYDGTVELGEDAKAYALNIKEMRGIATRTTSEFPASHGVTTAHSYAPLIKENMPGISAPSPRCGQAPPTDIPLTGTKLQNLIESNLVKNEILFYQQRAAFDYSKTGTDHIESLFDRLKLTPEQRLSLYRGSMLLVSNVRIHNEITDVVLKFEQGNLSCKKLSELAKTQQNRLPQPNIKPNRLKP